MNDISSISVIALDTVTGGRLANPPGGDFNPGGAGEAKGAKKSFRDKVADKINEWDKWNRVFPYKP